MKLHARMCSHHLEAAAAHWCSQAWPQSSVLHVGAHAAPHPALSLSMTPPSKHCAGGVPVAAQFWAQAHRGTPADGHEVNQLLCVQTSIHSAAGRAKRCAEAAGEA